MSTSTSAVPRNEAQNEATNTVPQTIRLTKGQDAAGNTVVTATPSSVHVAVGESIQWECDQEILYINFRPYHDHTEQLPFDVSNPSNPSHGVWQSKIVCGRRLIGPFKVFHLKGLKDGAEFTYQPESNDPLGRDNPIIGDPEPDRLCPPQGSRTSQSPVKAHQDQTVSIKVKCASCGTY